MKSTGKADKREAQVIANQYVAGWKLLIKQAEGGGDTLLIKAIRWREEINRTRNEEHREALQGLLLDKAEEIAEQHGIQKAKEVYGVAVGTVVLTLIHYEEWKAQIKLTPKTRDQMVKDVKLFVDQFTTIGSVSKQAVKAWVNRMGNSLSSNKRILSFCRNYWKYLQSHDLVPADFDPFSGVLTISKSKKGNGAGAGGWQPFEPADVVRLYKESLRRDDPELSDLIVLGAYTGARIEELCSLKVSELTEQSFNITDSKTAAGVREVPIHSALFPLVEKLKNQSTDGYLLSGLTMNKYGDRSNAVGKRFGRLKKDLMFTNAHVFHSIRKTMVTLLENAGVGENTTADIVGHEKPRITYGLYSGGASLILKKKAIELVSYEF